MIKFAECFSDQLVPYVQYCVHAIFPQAQIALHLGITIGQLQKEVKAKFVQIFFQGLEKLIKNQENLCLFQGITYLDRKRILEPLISLLPIKNIVHESLPPMSSMKIPESEEKTTLEVPMIVEDPKESIVLKEKNDVEIVEEELTTVALEEETT